MAADRLHELLSTSSLHGVLVAMRHARDGDVADRLRQQLDRGIAVIEFLCHPTPNTVINAVAAVESPQLLGELATAMITAGNKRHRLTADVRKAIEAVS
jgi:hypothetical protein